MNRAQEFASLTRRFNYAQDELDFQHTRANLEDIYRTVGARGDQRELPNPDPARPVDIPWRGYVLRLMPKRPTFSKRLFVICPECARPYELGHFFQHANHKHPRS